MKKNDIKNIAALVLAAALAACGGGGGGGSTATTTTPVAIAAPTPAPTVPIVTSVPVATYAAGSEEKAAFDLLNAERAACGFGLLAQNAALDTAAKGHADWLLANKYSGHFQIAGTTGFTGVTPADRMASAGYGSMGSFDSTETTIGAFVGKTGLGVLGMKKLLNAPYHLLAMIRGFGDVGISAREIGTTTKESQMVLDYGNKNNTGKQIPQAGSVRTYPCGGSVNIDRALYDETPSPVPTRNLHVLPLGSSIAIVVDVGHTITISNSLMVNVATGGNVMVRPAITAANDPNAVAGVSYFSSNEAFISADAPLAALTTYQATINGTDNGVAFSRTFQFTTGN
jgi:Cysteine-rich secretory protein family